MSNYRFSIPFRYMEAILAFAGTDARFSRHGFLAEPSAEYLRLIATDGNRMAILSIPAEKAQAWYWDAPSIPGHDDSEYLAEPLFVPAPERLAALKPPRNINIPILAHVSIEQGFFDGGGTLRGHCSTIQSFPTGARSWNQPVLPRPRNASKRLLPHQASRRH